MTGKHGTVEQRFWPKVEKTETCWLWLATTTHDGYPMIYRHVSDGGHVYAHRWAYETLVGPIPEGLELDHLCRVRHCVNPAHLEPITHRENIARGTNRIADVVRTGRCVQGHDLDVTASVDRNGGRRCGVCAAAYARKRRKRQAGEQSDPAVQRIQGAAGDELARRRQR